MLLKSIWNTLQGIIDLVFRILSSRIFKIILFCCLLAFLIFFWRYAETDPGSLFLKKSFSQFPFAEFVFDKYKTITGYTDNLPEIGAQKLSVNFLRLLVNCFFKGIFFLFLSKVFLRLPDYPVNQILNRPEGLGEKRKPGNQILAKPGIFIAERILDYSRSDHLESFASQPLFKLKTAFFSGVANVSAAFIANLAVSSVSDLLGGLPEQKQTVWALILFILFTLLYVLLYSLLRGASVNFSLSALLFLHLIPDLIPTMLVTSSMVLVYAAAVSTGFSTLTVLSAVLLLLVCALSEWLTGRMQILLAGSVSKERQKNNIEWENAAAASFFYTVCFSYYFFVYSNTGNTAVFNTPAMKLFFDLPGLPFFQPGSFDFGSLTADSVFDLVSDHIGGLFLFVLLVYVSQHCIHPRSMVGWFVYQTLCTGLIVPAYSLIRYICGLYDFCSLILIICVLLAVMLSRRSLGSAIGEFLLLAFTATATAVVLFKTASSNETFIIAVGTAVTILFAIWFALDIFVVTE